MASYSSQGHAVLFVSVNLFQVSQAASNHRYLHKKKGGAHEYLCNRLFQMSLEAVDRILSPLCDLAVRASGPDPALQRTLVGLAQQSTKLAVKVRLADDLN